MSPQLEAAKLIQEYLAVHRRSLTYPKDDALRVTWQDVLAVRNRLLEAPLEVRRSILHALPDIYRASERALGHDFIFLWQNEFLEEAFARQAELTASSWLDYINLYELRVTYSSDVNFFQTLQNARTQYVVRRLHKLSLPVLQEALRQLPNRAKTLSSEDAAILTEAANRFREARAPLDRLQLPDDPDEAASAILEALEAYWLRLSAPEAPDSLHALHFTKQMASSQLVLGQPPEILEALRHAILKMLTLWGKESVYMVGLNSLLHWAYETPPALTIREAEALFAWMRHSPTLKADSILFSQLQLARTQLQLEPPAAAIAPIRRTYPDSASRRSFLSRSGQVIKFSSDAPPLNPGEAWADNVLSDLEVLPLTQKTAWQALLEHCETATISKPNAVWQKRAQERLQVVGADAALDALPEWLFLVGKPRTILLQDSHKDAFDPFNELVLRGLVWCLALLPPTPETARVLGHLVETSLKKVPGVGPRSRKTASAALYTLSQLGGPDVLAQLSRLRSRVLFKPVLKDLDRALDAEAAKAGLSREDLDELSVPTFGLKERGVRSETLGDTTAELRVFGKNVTLTWRNAAGKALKSPPAAVKRDFADDLKELKDAQKDAAQTLGSTAARLDGLFLAQKSWTLKRWRERLLEHPLVGTVARRLIWVIDGRSVGVTDAGLEDADGRIHTFSDDAVVTLWHPLEHETEVMAWREWLATRSITQPFKQAHREVYRLTGAEEQTRVYSNRFAAHILKQHQFNALCALRGWRNTLRLMVDDLAPPATLELPRFGVRAEFWIEGVDGEYRRDTTDTGTHLYLSTDQVRFYRLGEGENVAHMGGGGYGPSRRFPIPAEPVPLTEVPPLVFSEVMRDIDLFVGVSSIANDPTWLDQSERHTGYWRDYGFGKLSATAETRKDLLAALLPRLSLRDSCRLEGRFLVVQGVLRTYRIHLGSTNILMEPGSEYLCIVPNRGFGWRGDGVFLPFEGDSALSIILSKAFMLADDTAITDPLIVRQIRR